MISVDYHDDLKEVQSDALLARVLSPETQSAPFDRLAWYEGLAAHCDIKPLLAVAREGDDVVVLPLQEGEHRLAALSNWYAFRFRPLSNCTEATPRLLAAIARDLSHRTDRITLDGVPDEDGSATLVEEAFRQAGWIVLREIADTNHVLAVDGRSYDEFLASRPGKLRTTLKRKAKKCDVEVLTRFDAEVWDAYEDIYAESWKPDEGSPAFLRAFAEAEGNAGRLRLGIARAEGSAIAAQMWTVEGGTAFIHKLAHRESAKALSPGSVLSAALFRHVIDTDRVDLIDFGTGDDSYKRDWMEQVRPRYRIDLLRPLAPRNWLIFAKNGLRHLAGGSKHG